MTYYEDDYGKKEKVYRTSLKEQCTDNYGEFRKIKVKPVSQYRQKILQRSLKKKSLWIKTERKHIDLMNPHKIKKKTISYYNFGIPYFTTTCFYLAFIRNYTVYGAIKVLICSLKYTIKNLIKHIS